MATKTCPKCDGDGEVPTYLGSNRPPPVDAPMRTCPQCNGSGEVWCLFAPKDDD